jgi:pyrimidine operon attenuation protein/uracil phosphoribosyltransferase
VSKRNEKLVLRAGDVERVLTRVAHEIAERNPDAPAPALVGIHRRGAFLARRLQVLLQELLGEEVQLGDLDIGFYRDDLGSRPDARSCTPPISTSMWTAGRS